MSGSVKGWWLRAAAATVVAAALIVPAIGSSQGNKPNTAIKHVLLISVDGLHQSDLATFVDAHPSSTLAKLTNAGTTFTSASTTKPSDSFPGLIAPVTGGTPKTTGVFYDDSYDRTMFAPGSNCAGSPVTETVYDESIDVGATTSTRTVLGESIDSNQLPEALVKGQCVAVQPNDFLRTNTIFSVAHAAGLRTAWSDKHPAYQLVNGHGTPNAVDDLFTPEINADIVPGTLTDTRGNTITFPFPSSSSGNPAITDFVANTEAYDQIKVDAILNEIDGFTSGHTSQPGTPAIYGMNFQAVSVGEKDVDPALSCDTARHIAAYTCDPSYVPGGYKAGTLAFTAQMDGTTNYAANQNPSGTPLAVPGALNYVDGALGQMISELQAKGELGSTRIIIEAKHGQSPINPAELAKIGHKVTSVLGNAGVDIAHTTDDDVALVWLANQAHTAAAVTALTTAPGQGQAHVQTVLSGATLAGQFGDPTTDSRTPDLIVEPTLGTIYSTSAAKVAEHGGFADPDTHVGLLITDGSNYGADAPAYNDEAVKTTQIAPTVLDTLGLDPQKLDAVRAEGTRALPGFGG